MCRLPFAPSIAAVSCTSLAVALSLTVCTRVGCHTGRGLNGFVPTAAIGIALYLCCVAVCLAVLGPRASSCCVAALDVGTVSILLYVVVIAT